MAVKLFVGLGNPGAKYALNRHNVGFMAVDTIAETHGFSPWRKRFQGLTAEAQMGAHRIILLKPMTYMNESGRAVGEAMRFYKLLPGDVTVFHDELDLEPGKVKVKTGGGHAGHNGLKSIAAHIGPDFRRVRIGIGHPGNKALVINYVLADFSKADHEWLAALLGGIAQAAPRLAEGADASFMNEVVRQTRPSKRVDAKQPAAAEEASVTKPPVASVDTVIADASLSKSKGERSQGGFKSWLVRRIRGGAFR